MSEFDLKQITAYAIKACEVAAEAVIPFVGKGNSVAADNAAVSAMRTYLNSLSISANIAIGEGERDNAPMLYIGEKLGLGGVEIDIAVDPLEGTALCADNKQNAISIIMLAKKGAILHAPDIYMNKIATKSYINSKALNIDAGLTHNINVISNIMNKKPSEITISMLDRPRHYEFIREGLALGVNIILIEDGDIIASIIAASPNSEVDMYCGIGGAPEGVITGGILKAMNATFLCKFAPKNGVEHSRLHSMGCKGDIVYYTDDMVHGPYVVAATGVTDGVLLAAPHVSNSAIKFHSKHWAVD